MPSDPPRPPTPPPALLAQVHHDLAPLARTRRRRLLLFTPLALALTALAAYTLGHTPQGFPGPGCGSPLHTTIMLLFTTLGLTLIALAFGLSLRLSPLPPGRHLRALPALATLTAFAGLATLATRYPTPAGDLHHGIPCLATGAIIALILTLLTTLIGRPILRRHAPTAPLFGVGVGLLALVPLSLACHDASMSHLMLWHGLIPIAGGAIGVLAWRPAPRADR